MLPKLCSTIEKNHIPIIIAAMEIIIVITIKFLLLNFDQVDLLSLSEMCTYYRGKNPFNAFISDLENIVVKVGGGKIVHLNSPTLVKLVPGSLHTIFY